ncbi:MAG TPA: primosomal protein N' [Steroidobacteraceae bacterium]|nr:primosomal protein N' [Steroidobacteraceae bacterium]
MILQVALDAPLRRLFDYLPPRDGGGAAGLAAAPQPGVRVWVPFGRRRLLGIVVAVASGSPLARGKLKTAFEILDRQPVFDAVTFDLLRWAADYYHHPIGEVFAAALPASLRAGQTAATGRLYWDLTPAGRRELQAPRNRRAPRQRALLAGLGASGAQSAQQLAAHFQPVQIRAAAARGWICRVPDDAAAQAAVAAAPLPLPASVDLTSAQRQAVAAIQASRSRFAAHLLYGVTGSGKTEVYLRVIAACIADGGQALILVPEIALTPQLVERFRRRFDAQPAILHSALAVAERRDAWRRAHGGEARIVIGTRSAVFASLPKLAVIVVDEEHDASYKQHEGFRYSARDLAVLRAQRAAVPIVLGSATPSLESLENAAQGRYAKLLLPQRPGAARPARMTLVDLRKHAVEQGLSQPVIHAISRHLAAGGQVIVFLNRRGYAPTLYCNACGWVAPCAHCDARMSLHRRAGRLRCHHCGAQRAVPDRCAVCDQPLNPLGQGTERVEETLTRLFPAHPLARLDRDTAAPRGALAAVLERVHGGSARILVGTQMLTKGHHFPDVSLVVILDADQGLFATDYRASERLAQTIIQVAGRAGRAARRGEVMIQTEFPDHPLLNRLISSGYDAFAAGALRERREAHWPPFSRLAMLRAEAADASRLDAFLRHAADLGRALCAAQDAANALQVLGPASALIGRRADRFRAHLLIEADGRAKLQNFLAAWLPQVEALREPPGLRWSIDVDPLEVD